MKRKNIITFILAFIITCFMAIGTSFFTTKSFKLFVNHPIILTFLFILFLMLSWGIIKMFFERLDEKKENMEIKKIKFNLYFDNHPFLFSIMFMILCWLIYIIAFYPAILSPDPSFQILQYFGIDNKYSYYSILIDKNVILTNHHPVIHTIILGSCVKIGLKLFSSTNIGLFIYSTIQTIILSFTLSYTIKFMKDINTNLKFRKICLFIYAFSPVFPLYAMSPVKDVIFGCLIIIYIITIYKFVNIKNDISYKDILKEIILLILITLFRNNGFHIILLSFPFLFLLGRKNIFKYLIIFLSVISFYFSYNKIILPYFKITQSSVREMLSIPFQQTARYVKEHKKEVTKEEKKVIDKILNYDTIAQRYNPKLADPVKNKFNRYYTNQDLKDYFKVWLNQFKKHPITYLEATIENTYGYFYPIETKWYVHTRSKRRINNYGFDYHFNKLNSLRIFLRKLSIVFQYLPFIGLIVNIGFNTWIILFMFFYLFYKKEYKNIIYLVPSFIILLMCFLSPANTYFRYALPNMFAMPVIISIFNKIKDKHLS